MKKRIFLSVFVLTCTMHLFAQTDDQTTQGILDFEEDTTSITSLSDIIKTQEQIYEKTYRSNFVKSVWNRKKAFTVSYENTTLKGKQLWMYKEGQDDYQQEDAEFESDWGVSIKRSRTSALHKHPIAEVLSFGLDHSFFDISVNHYKKMDGEKLYNSNKTWSRINDEEGTTDNFNYTTWGTEMYSFAYGIKIGPSITLAPFTHTRSRGLAHIRLLGYFNIGYRAEILWLRGDDKADANYENRKGYGTERTNFDNVSKSIKLNWGHGMTTSWGIRLNWKGIGIGYEVISGDLNFKSIETKIYGSKKSKFSQSTKRLSLTYVW